MKQESPWNQINAHITTKIVLFRTKIEWLYAWELMSLDGVVITAPDLEHDGAERTVIAFYSYWRQIEN